MRLWLRLCPLSCVLRVVLIVVLVYAFTSPSFSLTRYVSPFKSVNIDDEGTFRLTWWPPNDKLKGQAFAAPLSGEERMNVSQGLVVEARFTLPASSDVPPAQWPGFTIETTTPGVSTFVGLGLGPSNEGIAVAGSYHSLHPRDYFNWTAAAAGGAPQTLPTHAAGGGDWELADGASRVPPKTGAPSGSMDIRSGGPGQTSMALLAHPLWSEGHLITGANVSFRYISGYGCVPGACAGAPTVSLAVVDAFNHTVVRTLWTSSALDAYSYDHFEGYSPPVRGGAAGLAVGWPHQTQIALLLHNNKHNLQIPAADINVTLSWGGRQPQPWEPRAETASLKINERWGRDVIYTPGQVVNARLLYRRSMIEMYVQADGQGDYLYPVYSMPAASGKFGVSDTSAVGGARAWNMSLPGDENPGLTLQ